VTVDENLRCRVALNLILAETPGPAQKISRAIPNPADVLRTSVSELTAIGLSLKKAKTIASPEILDRADKEIRRAEAKGITILTPEDDRYPDLLREVFDPPFVLYCAGKVEALQGPAVAIVGARKSSAYGRAVGERLAQDLSMRGLVVVSGMARGIDSIAHWGALKGGRTVAVLGSGLDVVYPRENKMLFGKILQEGAVISEYPFGAPPLGRHFPLRNRIISGLVLALVVVEAAERSGSLISARLALEQNREVMAVPGNITSELSTGTNLLIKMGAKPVSGWEDVAEELPSSLRENVLESHPATPETAPDLSPEEKKIYRLMPSDSLIHVDELVIKSDYSVSEVLSFLLSLELKGLVVQSPGKYFRRKF